MSQVVEQAREYLAHNAAESGADVLIRELIDEVERRETALRNLVALEIGRVRHGQFAYVRSGPSLALCLNDARQLLGMADEPLK